MRKLLVLLITSVLATGAVANADTEDVVVNPDDYVSFLGIEDKVGDLIGDGGVISPVLQGTQQESDTFFAVELEITDDDTNAPLDQVAICLYDENQLDTPTEIADECGNGYGRIADNVVSTSGGNTGTKNIYSSVVATYWPNSTSNKIIGLTSSVHHSWRGESAGSQVTVSGDTHRLSAKFAISDLAVNSSDWKVRVVAQYRDETSPYAVTEVEAFSSETYQVAYFGQITTDSRGQVDFGNVIQEDKVEKGPIDTGNYRGNQIFLTEAEKAERFMTQLTDNPTFGVNTRLSGHNGDNFLGYIEADDHGCKLYVGDVPTGSYSNTMTLGITKYLPPTP